MPLLASRASYRACIGRSNRRLAGFVVGLAGGQALLEAVEESVEQVSQRNDVAVSVVLARR
jgi:hypothetical protein